MTGLILFGIGVWGSQDYIKTVYQGDAAPVTAVITESSVTPSEKKPDMQQEYTVPAHQPRRIIIGSLGVNAFVEKAGVTKDNAMATPSNIYFTGWYVKSVAPGDDGLSIINGHAGGRYEQGVFRNIARMAPQETFHIEMGDKTLRSFEVVSVRTYDLADAMKPLYEKSPDSTSELHLITCDGTFDDRRQTYDKRTIVVARYITSGDSAN